MRTIFFLMMLFVILGINYYVFYRLVYMLPSAVWARATVIGCGILVMLCFFGSFLAGDYLPVNVTSVMYTIGTSWFFIAIYFALIFLLLDLLRALNLAPIGSIIYKNWLSFFVVVGVVAVIAVMGYYKYLDKERVELNLTVNKQMGAPLKIVALSDLHLGYGIGKEEFAGWVELINKENPDIVLIPGDIVDNSVRALEEKGIADVFKQIKSKYGIYACMGNHEYISDPQRSTEFMEKAGIHLLRDSYKLIDNRFYVVGRDDREYFGRKPAWELTDSLNQSKLVIVLDHQPIELDDVLAHGVDLQLSGHTHQGQIWPISWITNAIYEKSHGYLKKKDTHFYVSSGIGVWGGKFRIGTQSEYLVINLSSNKTN